MRQACVACFSLYYLTFLWQRPTCSKVEVLCSARLEKLTCGYVRPSLKCHCCMMYHTGSSINKGGLKMSQAFTVQSCHFISVLLFIYLLSYNFTAPQFLLSPRGQSNNYIITATVYHSYKKDVTKSVLHISTCFTYAASLRSIQR